MASQNMETFDVYFRMADLDKDGRISGAEAVAFFQGSNLPKHILAQIWNHADQNKVGFLGRAEFFNALKLVTVAQSGRQLTSDIVKAALFGPAASKIPAPRINSTVPTTPQTNSLTGHGSGTSTLSPIPSQSSGLRGPQIIHNPGMSRPFVPTAGNLHMRPFQATLNSSLPMQTAGQGHQVSGNTLGSHHAVSNSSNLSTDSFGSRPTGSSMGPHAPNRVVSPSLNPDGLAGTMNTSASLSVPSKSHAQAESTPSLSLTQDGFDRLTSSVHTSTLQLRPQAPSENQKIPSIPSNQQSPLLPSLQVTNKDSKASTITGNGFSPELSMFGGDAFNVASAQPNQEASVRNLSSNTLTASSAYAPLTTETQSSVKKGQMELSQPSTKATTSSQLQQSSSSPAGTEHRSPSGHTGSATAQIQPQWPRITQFDIDKYTKVFVEVDRDRDGKITGDQARNLFLSWRLPREVLKQVWDLSDQDNDSMLSLREFCTALFLMEQYREGRPLPSVLPDSIRFDDTLLRATGQPAAAHSWQPTSVSPPQGFSGPRPGSPEPGLREPVQVPITPQADGSPQLIPQKSKVPVLDKHLVHQLSKDEQSALGSKFQEAIDAEKKVQDLEKDILDSKKKIEFYRSKMQELVLYKSRCDNRLNEIMERVSADKREAESLAKKYEEKYKQVGDVASKLTIEEATFRDIQERKMELYNGIVKMEQGANDDGVLQVRADQIQSDLEKLVNALNARCKTYGLRAKPTSLIELPFGWQPGLQEEAADWNEEWDKFEDEGFTLVNDLTLNVENKVAPPRAARDWNEKPSIDEAFGGASSNADYEVDKPSSTEPYAKNEGDLAKSPPISPHMRNSESPSREFQGTDFDTSPRMRESNSDHGLPDFTDSRIKFDEPPWGATFDVSDDTDSVWGLDPIRTKATDHEFNNQNSFFGSSDFGPSSFRTGSPHADSLFQRRSPIFADSVPSTPLFNSSPTFDRVPTDSFGVRDSGFFPMTESFPEFDHVRSHIDSDRSRGLPSFDDKDPSGVSTEPFKPLEGPTPRWDSDGWSAF